MNSYVFVENDPQLKVDLLGLLSLRFEAFIPNTIGHAVTNSPIPGVNWFAEPDPLSTWWTSTNNRAGRGSRGTSKVFITGSVNVSQIGSLEGTQVFTAESNESQRIRVNIERQRRNGGPIQSVSYSSGTIQRETSRPTGNETVIDLSRCSSKITYSASGSYPWRPLGFIPVPSVDFSVTWTVTRKEKENIVEIELSGSHNDFPSYQGRVNEEDFYFHEAIGDGPGFGNLRGTGSPFKPAKTTVGL